MLQSEREVDREVEQFDEEDQAVTKGKVIYGGGMRITDAEYEVLDHALRKVQFQPKYVQAAEDGWKRYQQLYLEPLEKQASFKYALDLFSPAAMFKRSASILSRTDVTNYETFFQEARRYRSQCIEYLDHKAVYTINAHLFFSRLKKEDIHPEATARRIKLYQQDPSLVPWIHSLPPLDLSDAPTFQPTEASFLADISRISLHVGLLLFSSIVLAVAAVGPLSRYDVR
jgi:hypothetical protein